MQSQAEGKNRTKMWSAANFCFYAGLNEHAIFSNLILFKKSIKRCYQTNPVIQFKLFSCSWDFITERLSERWIERVFHHFQHSSSLSTDKICFYSINFSLSFLDLTHGVGRLYIEGYTECCNQQIFLQDRPTSTHLHHWPDRKLTCVRPIDASFVWKLALPKWESELKDCVLARKNLGEYNLKLKRASQTEISSYHSPPETQKEPI